MARLVNLGAGLGLARGERCEGVKKGCIKKQETRLNFYDTNVIIGGDLKWAANNENAEEGIELLAQGSAHIGRTIKKNCAKSIDMSLLITEMLIYPDSLGGRFLEASYTCFD